MEYLIVGTIVKTHGLKGEVKIYPSTDFRDSRFKIGNHLFIVRGDNYIEVTIKSRKKIEEMEQIVFKEFSTIEEIEPFIKCDLVVEKDSKILKKNEYFYDDLLDCETYFDNGNYIGKVSKIEEYASYKTLRIARDGKDSLIPFVEAFIKDVNIADKKIIINYIDGLL